MRRGVLIEFETINDNPALAMVAAEAMALALAGETTLLRDVIALGGESEAGVELKAITLVEVEKPVRPRRAGKVKWGLPYLSDDPEIGGKLRELAELV